MQLYGASLGDRGQAKVNRNQIESSIINAIRRGRNRTPNEKFGAYHFTIKLLSLLAVA
jgi:hypothetical protein